MRRLLSSFLIGALLGGCGMDGWAIATADNIVSAGNPTNCGYNVNWDYVYQFRNSSAVAVERYWLLTAAHVADDGISGKITINGETYTPQVTVYHPSADLALVRFDRPFPGYYPLYEGNILQLAGGSYATLIMMGYGYPGRVGRAEFAQNGRYGIKRWGTNRGVSEQTTITVNTEGPAGACSTQCFLMVYTLRGSPYEAGGNQFDSGGPVFINTDTGWQLAGITLYRTGSVPDVYTGNYVARVPSYADWITAVITDYDSDMNGLPDWWEEQYVTASPQGFTSLSE